MRIEEHGHDVVGKRWPLPTSGRICVHILEPFGQCAVDEALNGRDERAAEEDLLRRLYRVCRWSEEHAEELLDRRHRVDDELARDASLCSPSELTAWLENGDTSGPEFEALSAKHDRYEVRLAEIAREHAVALDCPEPDVAASCWELLALNDFYSQGRNPLP